MKKCKKLTVILLIICMMFAFTGCGNKKNEDNENYATTEKSAAEEPKAEVPKKEVPKNYGDIVLGQYKNVEVQKNQTEATEEDWENEINAFLNYNAEPVQIEGKTIVEDGDIVNIDYLGKIDDVAFEGGTAEGAELTIGSNQFIDTFEEQLIGAVIGETRDINVSFPDPYTNNPDLAGKPAVFTVTINAIIEYVVPSLSDEAIAKYTDNEYETVEEYKEYIMNSITEEKTSYAENQTVIDVIQIIIDNSEISGIPDEITEGIFNDICYQYESYASSMEVTLELLVYYYFGMSLDNFYAEATRLADFRAKEQLILSEVIKLENLTLTEAEYEELLTNALVDSGFETTEELEDYHGKDYIMENFLMDKAYNLIIDSMIVKEYSEN